MKRQQAAQMQALADKAGAALRQDPLHPEKAAAVVGTMLITADNVQAGDPIPGIGVSKEITDAIAPLRKGEVTAPIVLPGDKVAIATVTDYQAARQASLDEAKTEVRNKASEQKLQEVLNKKAAELLSKAQSMGGDLAKAGKEMGIDVKTSPDVNRQGAIEGVGSASLLGDAFTKPVGSLIGPISVPGGRVVAKVVAKTPADLSDLPAQTSSIRDELKQQKIKDRATMFEAGLKKRLEEQGKLKIHQDVVTRLVQSYSTRG
jgi:peptidyl-prolyl cis-trans isomerase D